MDESLAAAEGLARRDALFLHDLLEGRLEAGVIAAVAAVADDELVDMPALPAHVEQEGHVHRRRLDREGHPEALPDLRANIFELGVDGWACADAPGFVGEASLKPAYLPNPFSSGVTAAQAAIRSAWASVVSVSLSATAQGSNSSLRLLL